MTVGSLFTGIGGFDLAARRAGIDIAYQIENDSFCNKVLQKNFPNVLRFGDIKNVSIRDIPRTDIICGGFPCQPFSVAGDRKGASDDRALWPEMLRIIQGAKPTWVIGENVPGIISMELDNILDDLENEGYETQTINIPAFSIGACHKRHRIWILAYSDKKSQSRIAINDGKTESVSTNSEQSGRKRVLCQYPNGIEKQNWSSITLDAKCNYFLQFSQIVGKSAVLRMDDGISNRVDRLGSIGNAIVPQIAYILFSYIIQIETQLKHGEHYAKD